MSKYDNFIRALDNLNDIYDYDEPHGNVELSGMVALYEICFEQAWKTMKELLDRHGYREGKTGSPKMIIRTAYGAGMLDNQELWLQALDDRNNVAHSYHEAIARGIIRNTIIRCSGVSGRLSNAIGFNWKGGNLWNWKGYAKRCASGASRRGFSMTPTPLPITLTA